MLLAIARFAKFVMLGSAAAFLIDMLWSLAQDPPAKPGPLAFTLILTVAVSAIVNALALLGSDPE